MAKKVKKDSGTEFPIEFLYGDKAPPQSVVRRGMADLEKELTSQFRGEREVEIETASYMKQVQDPLIQLFGRNKEIAAGVKGLSQLDARLGKVELKPPTLSEETQRVFAGSIGATVTPPYNYDWTWNTTSGGPSLSVSANRTTGQMGFNIWNAGRDASGSARAAVGIYFRPATENGILRLSSNPAFNYSWWTICAFASAHSDAWQALSSRPAPY